MPPIQGPQFQAQPWRTLPVTYPAVAPAAAPATAGAGSTFTDNFDRADSATTLGSPWGTFAFGLDGTNNWHQSTWGISSNRAYLVATPNDGLGDIAAGVAYINGGSPDGQLDLDLTTITPLDEIAAFRCDLPGVTPGDRSGYLVTASKLFWEAPFIGGAQVGAGFSSSFVSGDHLTIILTGATVDIRRNGSSVYTQILGNNPTSVLHGMAAVDITNRYDNFAWVPSVTASRGWVVGSIAMN